MISPPTSLIQSTYDFVLCQPDSPSSTKFSPASCPASSSSSRRNGVPDDSSPPCEWRTSWWASTLITPTGPSTAFISAFPVGYDSEWSPPIVIGKIPRSVISVSTRSTRSCVAKTSVWAGRTFPKSTTSRSVMSTSISGL